MDCDKLDLSIEFFCLFQFHAYKMEYISENALLQIPRLSDKIIMVQVRQDPFNSYFRLKSNF